MSEGESSIGVQVEHETLHQAIHGVQAEATTLQKSKLNPAFRSKYVPIDTLHEAVLPLVNKHGLTWTTRPAFTVEEGKLHPTLVYDLRHVKSDKGLTGEMLLLLSKQDPQGQGSGITYARRYCLMAVLGLVADEDDDANSASGKGKTSGRQQAARKAPSKPAAPAAPGAASSEALAKIKAAAKAAGLTGATLKPILTEAGLAEDKGPRDLTEDQATWVVLKLAKLAKEQDAQEQADRAAEVAHESAE